MVTMNIETGMTAVLSMSVMFWMRMRNICVTPQNAERPRMERRTMGCLQVAAKLRREERKRSFVCIFPTLMQKQQMLAKTLSPR